MHHARLLIGTFETALSYIDIEDQTNGADTHVYRYDRLGIDEVRALREEAVLTPLTRTYRSFVLVFSNATVEAQNALLKLLEEPVSTTRFYIIVPLESILLATVRSRLMLVGNASVGAGHVSAAEIFLKMSYKERMKEITVRTKQKDNQWIREVIDGIELWAVKSKNKRAMKDVVFIRGYIENRGASKKMLMEHIAISIPPFVIL